ncbi:MAG: hypothetical protein WCD37_14405 [Chloroflexia bacterium]
MDPITLIVTALALGAAAGLKPTAEKAVKDAYEGLKGLILSRFGHASASVSSLEVNPASNSKRDSLKEDLESTAVKQDEEVLRKAKEVIDVVNARAPEAASAIGVDLERVRAAVLRIEDIIAEGNATAVRAKDVDVSGEMSIKNVSAVDTKREGESPNS